VPEGLRASGRERKQQLARALRLIQPAPGWPFFLLAIRTDWPDGWVAWVTGAWGEEGKSAPGLESSRRALAGKHSWINRWRKPLPEVVPSASRLGKPLNPLAAHSLGPAAELQCGPAHRWPMPPCWLPGLASGDGLTFGWAPTLVLKDSSWATAPKKALGVGSAHPLGSTLAWWGEPPTAVGGRITPVSSEKQLGLS